MALFLATHINRVDKKGRVSVPASFRAALSGESFQGIVLFRSHQHSCLEGFAMSTMEELSSRVDHFDLFSEAQDDLATTIFGDSVPLPLDGDGRIIMPGGLLDHALIADEAAFVGMGRKFQIWAPQALEARRDEARSNVRDKGLTLPKREGSA